MATITEQQKDITEYFDNKEHYFAHCISSDCKMGAGIAPIFDKHFKLKDNLLSYSESQRREPTCILVNNVFNLITKEHYWDKPTIGTILGSLFDMKSILLYSLKEIPKTIIMPRIGCGLDKLSWPKVKNIIENVFRTMDNLEIIVCYL